MNIKNMVFFFSFIIFSIDSFANETITEDMRHNFESLMRLQSLVVDPEKFSNSDHDDEIKEQIKILSKSAEKLPSLIKTTKPNLIGIALMFSDYVNQIQINFKSGYKDYSRFQLRALTNFCVACHTRSSVAEFTDSENRVEKSKLSRLQKAEYLLATRQFDKAIALYNEIVSSPVVSELEWKEVITATRQFLSIAVRVKKDPQLALNFINKVSMVKSVSDFYRRDFKAWVQDLNQWIKEPKAKTKSAKDLLRKSNNMLATAKKQQLYPADHAADIILLRATNELHEAIELGLDKQSRAEAFYNLALAYRSLTEPLMWELDLLYLEACIQEVPHTNMSKTCFRQLSSNVYLGFSGSSGINIPADQLEKLSRLRKQAF